MSNLPQTSSTLSGPDATRVGQSTTTVQPPGTSTRQTVRVRVSLPPAARVLLGSSTTGGVVRFGRFGSEGDAVIALIRRALSMPEVM